MTRHHRWEKGCSLCISRPERFHDFAVVGALRPGGAYKRTTGCSHRCSRSSTANATFATHLVGDGAVWKV